MRQAPVFDDVLGAAKRIRGHVRRTPVVTSATLDAQLGCQVFLKCENLQHTGAFKLRGATNAVLMLDETVAERGVATHSSGNHGAALAAAARSRGIAAWVVVPENASPFKLRNMASHGATIVTCGPGLANRERGLEAVVVEHGASVVHPFDDARVIAGQGTAALELLEDEPQLDVMLVPVGGGGLAAGTLLTLKAVSPGTRLVGVEPEGADDAIRSLQRGERVVLDNPETLADGLRASLGVINFKLLAGAIDEIVPVSDAEILAAKACFAEMTGLNIEPSSATVIAALLGNKAGAAGKRVGAIISGGNVESR